MVILANTLIATTVFNELEITGIGSVIPAYAKNINYLNNCADMDRFFVVCYHVNVNFLYATGYDQHDPLFTAKLGLRLLGTFSKEQLIFPLPVDQPIQFLETSLDTHSHYVWFHMPWISELWLHVDLATLLNVPFKQEHTITIGLFPFYLGRGIALGFNNPDYQSPFFLIVPTFPIINQYPPGILISGNVFSALSYDFYGSILDNRAAHFDQTNLITKQSLYNHRHCGQRGFGSVHFNIAGRLCWDPVQKECEQAHMEMYTVFSDNPLVNSPFSKERSPLSLSDNQIENIELSLKTFGVAGEYVTGNWEFGFDTAKNFGYALFTGIDTNQLTLTTNAGFLQTVNNNVTSLTGLLAPSTPDNQYSIDNSLENQAQNGQLISATLRNGFTRFRDTFSILMVGWMFVADAAYTFNDTWQWATTIGIASGGPILNQLTKETAINRNFVSIQELYRGKRVHNAFF